MISLEEMVDTLKAKVCQIPNRFWGFYSLKKGALGL